MNAKNIISSIIVSVISSLLIFIGIIMYFDKSKPTADFNPSAQTTRNAAINDAMKAQIEKFEEAIEQNNMPEEARDKAVEEYSRLIGMDRFSHEANEIQKYLDLLVSLPWNNDSISNIDLVAAKRLLDADHYGLDKVKENIIEFLSVQKRKKTPRGQVLLFVGPPGVGKTSLAKSIAKAMGREFFRVSMGGVRDESAIRGFPRTYISSRPGKIIAGMKKVGKSNPVILIDEIDKMIGANQAGDPQAALLELLDPEQNNSFKDHYLEVEYDMSKVLFIATANTLEGIPSPLLDRAEIIEIEGYTPNEKLTIAKQHLIKKEMEKTGLKATEFTISDAAVVKLISEYTREAGVRGLTRLLNKVCRKVLYIIQSTKIPHIDVTEQNVRDYIRDDFYPLPKIRTTPQVGVANGLAYTTVGGSTLSVEALIMPGSGKITMTGNLGAVMKESIDATVSYIKSHHEKYGINPKAFKDFDLHVHLPDTSTPKDGPSAGVALFTAVLSAYTKRPVRHDIAMTGEIDLEGNVLPIGGLKNKLLGAQQSGIKTVLLPIDNERHLKEVPAEAKDGLEIIFVKNVAEVAEKALVK